MTSHANASAGCMLIGEYVDETELPADLASALDAARAA